MMLFRPTVLHTKDPHRYVSVPTCIWEGLSLASRVRAQGHVGDEETEDGFE